MKTYLFLNNWKFNIICNDFFFRDEKSEDKRNGQVGRNERDGRRPGPPRDDRNRGDYRDRNERDGDRGDRRRQDEKPSHDNRNNDRNRNGEEKSSSQPTLKGPKAKNDELVSYIYFH